MRALLGATVLTSLLGSGCMAEGIELVGETESSVMQWIDFGRVETRGVTVGFNLDDAVTTIRDRRGCAQDDFVSPEGLPGVDNNMALIMPLLDLAAEDALQSLLQNALNEGRMLVFIERTRNSDGSYHLRFRRGDDTPLLGTDGFLLPGQTLGLHEEAFLGEVDRVMPDDDLFVAQDFNLRLPAVVFATLYVLDLKNARMRFELAEDGRLVRGLMGGGLELTQIFDILRVADSMINPDSSTERLIGGSLRELADLAPLEGTCQQISVGIEFEAVPAFVFE